MHEGKNIKDILHLARRCAKTNANILLLGESGVGKEVFAKYIHSQSLRFKESFIAINMAAIPDNLLESELFGYEKGAFTDASTLKIGLFEKANLGTLFLDEITEMPLGLQAKLLRAIQEREIVRLGGLKSIPLNVRFISASNANIEDKIKANLFREDLFYRLQTIPIYIPPLRERLDEIPHLVKLKLALLEKEYDMSPKFFNQEALESLAKYSWPGNIRELFSVVERSFILSSTEEIGKKDLYLESRNILSKGSM